MIEVLSTSRCTECDICVRVCPTNVFDVVEGAAPVIARQEDCQTCFQCEAYCPADALFVAPIRTPAPVGSPWKDEAELARTGELGLYRSRVGWGKNPADHDPAASVAVMELMMSRLSAPKPPSPTISNPTISIPTNPNRNT